jgi:hypothetical protein
MLMNDLSCGGTPVSPRLLGQCFVVECSNAHKLRLGKSGHQGEWLVSHANSTTSQSPVADHLWLLCTVLSKRRCTSRQVAMAGKPEPLKNRRKTVPPTGDNGGEVRPIIRSPVATAAPAYVVVASRRLSLTGCQCLVEAPIVSGSFTPH